MPSISCPTCAVVTESRDAGELCPTCRTPLPRLLGILVMGDMSGPSLLVSLVFIGAFVIPLVGTLVNFGLLAIVAAFLTNQALNNAPLTLDWSMPYAPAMLWSLLLVAALATFGFYTARGGQPLLGRLSEGS